VDVHRACCFSEISPRVHIIRNRTFIVLVASCFEGEVSVGGIDGRESVTVLLPKPCFVLKLRADSSFEERMDSGQVGGQLLKVFVSVTSDSCALSEESCVTAVPSVDALLISVVLSLPLAFLTRSGSGTEAARSCKGFPEHSR